MGLDPDAAKKLLENGVQLKTHAQEANQIIYCPTGWYHAFWVVKGPVVYGLRKSIFLDGDAAGQKNYVAMKELLAASGADTSRMDQIEALFGGKP
eukprot:9319215-Alexandrium_andersonii.AAC.1